MVPAFPATCYQSEDFSAPADKAYAALAAAIERQQKINAAIEQEFKEMDMAEMAQRMQAFMMKDPQRAADMLRGQQAVAAAASDKIQRAADTVGPLEAALKNHTAKFQAAVKGVRDPIDAQMKQLTDAKALPAHEFVVFGTAADEAQYLGLLARLNTDYEKICAAWWGPSGAFQTWLGDLKTYYANLILSDEQAAAAMAFKFALLDTPSGGYRTTHAMSHVQQYVRRAREVFELRPQRIAVGKPGDYLRK
jgi:hypothetical protein